MPPFSSQNGESNCFQFSLDKAKVMTMFKGLVKPSGSLLQRCPVSKIKENGITQHASKYQRLLFLDVHAALCDVSCAKGNTDMLSMSILENQEWRMIDPANIF